MKEKIIKSYSSKDLGVSSITIQNKYGKFYGMAFCHPDEIEHFSAFTGERYAEIRARTEFAKLRYRQEKIKLKTINNLLKDINNTIPSIKPEENSLYKRILLQKRNYSNSVENWKNYYEYLSKEAIPEREKTRIETLERIEQLKQKKDETI